MKRKLKLTEHFFAHLDPADLEEDLDAAVRTIRETAQDQEATVSRTTTAKTCKITLKARLTTMSVITITIRWSVSLVDDCMLPIQQHATFDDV